MSTILKLSLSAPNSRSKSPNGSNSPKYPRFGRDLAVAVAPQGLGAAERVLQPLTEHPRKQVAEKMIGHPVEKLHRALLHRIDEAAWMQASNSPSPQPTSSTEAPAGTSRLKSCARIRR